MLRESHIPNEMCLEFVIIVFERAFFSDLVSSSFVVIIVFRVMIVNVLC